MKKTTWLFLVFMCIQFAGKAQDTLFLTKYDEPVTRSLSYKYATLTITDSGITEQDFYSADNSLMMIGTLDNSMKQHGLFTYYKYSSVFKQNPLWYTKHYEHGKVVGEETHYYPNGRVYYTENHHSKTDWEIIRYYETGMIESRETVKNYIQTERVCYDQQGNETKCIEMVEEEAQFPRGVDNLFKFISENTHYPPEARERLAEGKVTLSFVIDEIGKIHAVKVIQSVCPSIDAEAVRIIKSMPNWKPGKQNGKTVESTFSLPIVFMLDY